MKFVIQRVKNASVEVDKKVVGKIKLQNMSHFEISSRHA